MQHRVKRSLGDFVHQDALAIVVRFTGVNDERKTGGACGRNMSPEAALLRLARPMLVEIIEAGFAKRDDFGMLGQRDQFFGWNPVFLVGLVRMGADRAIDLRIFFRDSEKRIEASHPCRDRDDTPDAGGLGPRDNAVEVVGKIRKVEMAMAIDEHRLSLRLPLARYSAEIPGPVPEAPHPA